MMQAETNAASRPDGLSRAYELHATAMALAEAGDVSEAVIAETEAVDILRSLDDADRYLAEALSNLGTYLDRSGRTAEALAVTAEAVRTLSDMETSAERHEVVRAACLANLSSYLSQTGRVSEAIGPMQEALDIRRALAAHNDVASRADLAISLHNAGPTMLAADRASEALPLVEEAVRIRRDLADADPGSYRYTVARSLANLSEVLDKLGRPDEALLAARESAEIMRELTARDPARYEFELLNNLTQLCKVLASQGRAEEIAGYAQEVIAILRRSAEHHPEGIELRSAHTLHNIAAAYSKLGRPAEALPLAEEASALYRELADSDEQRFTSDLARSLNNLGSILFSLGRHADAVAPAEQAVALRRALAQGDPELHQADLAHSLASLGPILAVNGKATEAVAGCREAIRIYQELSTANPDRYRDEFLRAIDALTACKASLTPSASASALPRWPIVTSTGPEPTDELAGPLVMTYTFPLPFPLGLQDGGSYYFSAPGTWTEPDSATTFGDDAMVVIRLCNLPKTMGVDLSASALAAIFKLYDQQLTEIDQAELSDEAGYEQWATVETPYARITSDDPRDDAFTFHRSLEVLGRYLRAHYQTFKDVRVRAVTTRDLGPLVIRGAYTLADSREWHFLGVLAMHPDARPVDPEQSDPHQSIESLASIYGQLDIHPFLPAVEWLRRAEYSRRYSGDSADVVVSLQISMESMIYRTWGMILVDQGKTSADISAALNSRPGYRPLLTTTLPALLGGRWDITAPGTPVGNYWHRLYQMRNAIVHRGHQASWAESEAAYYAYLGMRDFINERLWAKHKKYPRTLLIKLGEGGLQRKGWHTRWMGEFIEKAKHEPGIFYLAHDIAGRSG